MMLLPGEIVVDNFAGGGGASEGIRRVLRRSPDISINHDRWALAIHAANHPDSLHLCEDVRDVDPVKVCAGRPVGLAHFSPDCKDHSRAKGGKPRDKDIRALAWVVVKWARTKKPRVIVVENVREFEEWGPLKNNRRDPARKGWTFRQWVGRLRGLGYQVEWRVLNAADFGAPTHRRRLFIVARCDGQPIRWPVPTHGPGREHPYRTAAECIDWSLPTCSIFATRPEAREWARLHGQSAPVRPLAEKTMERIARGVVKYVLENPQPFIVQCQHGRDSFRGQSIDRPLSTITSHHGFGIAVPHLTHYYGLKGGETRASAVDHPLRTQTAENRFGLVTAWLAKHYGGVVGHAPDRPIGTITARDHHSVAVAHLTKFYGTNVGSDPRAPLPTVTSGGNHVGLVAAFLCKYYKSGGQWQDLRDPLHTIVAKARYGLVTVTLGGEEWVISDIGLRMLEPRELARCQGFQENYVLFGSKARQTAMIGNSVPPDLEAAVVAANLGRGDQVEAVA